MAHAGTMVGGSAQTKQNGSPWTAIALTVAVVVAAIAGVWLAASAGLVGGTAKPAADRSYDQIEAQRGAITLSGGSSQAYDERLNGILDKAHAAPYVGGAVTLPDNLSTRRGYAIAAQPGAVTLPDNLSTRRGYAIAAQPGAVTLPDNLSTRRGYAIAAQPGAVTLPDNLSTRRGYAIAATLPLSATSGTFHAGWEANQVTVQPKRTMGPHR